jgi:hypothetical protein
MGVVFINRRIGPLIRCFPFSGQNRFLMRVPILFLVKIMKGVSLPLVRKTGRNQMPFMSGISKPDDRIIVSG